MPICRLHKNHALSRRGGLPPLFRLIHPQPLMTQAKQNKERFIHRRSARSLVSLFLSFSLSLSLFLFFPPLSLSPSSSLSLSLSFHLSFSLSHSLLLYVDGPRLFRAISFVSLARINSSLRFPSLARSRSPRRRAPRPTYARSHCLCLSLYPTYPPSLPSFTLSLFPRLARSLAHMRANEID